MTKTDKALSVFGQDRLKWASKWSMGGFNYSLDSPKNKNENSKSKSQYLAFHLGRRVESMVDGVIDGIRSCSKILDFLRFVASFPFIFVTSNDSLDPTERNGSN